MNIDYILSPCIIKSIIILRHLILLFLSLTSNTINLKIYMNYLLNYTIRFLFFHMKLNNFQITSNILFKSVEFLLHSNQFL